MKTRLLLILQHPPLQWVVGVRDQLAEVIYLPALWALGLSVFSVPCPVSACGHHPLPAPGDFCDLGVEPAIKYATFYPFRFCWWGQTTSHSSASHFSGNELLNVGLGQGLG